MTLALNPTDLLIAPPNMPDPRFRDSVLMLTQHDTVGSHGLVVNRPLATTLAALMQDTLADLALPPTAVYWGGPVSSHSIWMLHSAEWQSDTTVTIDHEWAMTSNMQMFYAISVGDWPAQWRMFVGYATWQPGQLACELGGLAGWRRSDAWLTASNQGAAWLFEQPIELMWRNAITLSSHQAVDTWL